MKQTLSGPVLKAALDSLTEPNRRFTTAYPGESGRRQPLHTVYGGAHLFEADLAGKLGQLARASLQTYAPDPASLALAVGMDPAIAEQVYPRVVTKLQQEPVEDFRIDFEDGFGNRPDAEEDAAADNAAKEVALGMREASLPPFIGIRIKPLGEELKLRSARTLDIFLSTLLAETGGKLPDGFVVTLPKIPVAEHVSALVCMLAALETAHGLDSGTIKMEMMIELTQSIMDRDGRCNLPSLLEAAEGRCVAAHFGTYDYTASCNITAEHQRMDHPSCDFAKLMMQTAYANTGVQLSDGATNIMPAGPHKGAALSDEQRDENRRVVHGAWQTAYRHIRHSLSGGFYQGWDLHPAQLPIRYAACFAFFLEGLGAATARLSNFINKAAQATLVGDVFDDAATGQGLLNYFLRAYGSGAISLDEVKATGLTLEDVQTRSFLKILERRK